VQQKRRGVFGAGLSVKDGESVDLGRAIKSDKKLGGSRDVLSSFLARQPERRERHRNQQRNAGEPRALNPQEASEKAHGSSPLMRASCSPRFALRC